MARLFPFACGHPGVPAPFVEKVILSSVVFLGALFKTQLVITARVHFRTLSCTSLVCLSVPKSITLF